MTRYALAGCMALAMLGALGTVGAPAQADPPENRFAGSWSGTWSHVEDEVVGTWDDWTISDTGRISGTFYSITNDFAGKIVGKVDADGKLVMIGVAYPGAFSFQGTAMIDGDGKLAVSVKGTWSGAFSLVGILERS